MTKIRMFRITDHGFYVAYRYFARGAHAAYTYARIGTDRRPLAGIPLS